MAEDSRGVDQFNEILTGLADARIDDAARSRSRRSWMIEQAATESTLAGFVRDLVDTKRPVSVVLHGPTELRGTPRALGADLFVLGTRSGLALVALDAVVSMRLDEGESAAPGDGAEPSARRLTEVLSDAAADRRKVQVITADGRRTTGELRAVGADVLTLRTGDAGAGIVVIAHAALVACVLLDAR